MPPAAKPLTAFLSAFPSQLSAAFPLWLAAVNLFTFLLFGLDKHRAQHRAGRRVPERTLLLLSALGGSPGALLGMKLWRHKTRHNAFRIGIPAILLAHLILAGWLLSHQLPQ